MSFYTRLLLGGSAVICLLATACQRQELPRLTLPPLTSIPTTATLPPTPSPAAAVGTPTTTPATAMPPSTAVASPTLAPTAPTQSVPASTPTTGANTPTPVSTPTVNYFRANVDTADPGATITLEWSTSNAAQAAIYHVFDGRLGEPSWSVGPSGSLQYAIGAQERNAVVFVLFASDGVSAGAQASVTVTLRCTAQWFFSAPPDICPQEWALASPAAEQQFEHGVLLWVWAEDRIYVLYHDSSPRWQVYTDEFDDGETESDPTLTPPPGLWQPVRGFGRVWREEANVRDRLGWAAAPESGFTTFVQRTSYSRYNATYLQALDGAIYHLGPEGSSWEKRAP